MYTPDRERPRGTLCHGDSRDRCAALLETRGSKNRRANGLNAFGAALGEEKRSNDMAGGDNEPDVLRDAMGRLSDEELRKVLTVDAASYREEAVAAARIEAQRRGIEVPPARALESAKPVPPQGHRDQARRWLGGSSSFLLGWQWHFISWR